MHLKKIIEMIRTYNNFLNVAVGVVGNSIESRRVEVLVDEAKSVAQWLDGCWKWKFVGQKVESYFDQVKWSQNLSNLCNDGN